MIILYEWGDDSVWRIERKRRQVKPDPTQMRDNVSMTEDSDAITRQKVDVISTPDAGRKNTDEILAALVASGFDLNTLDEWDKIKNS